MGKGMGEAREKGGVREERTCVRYCGAGTMSRLRTIYAHTCTLIIILNYILHTHTHICIRNCTCQTYMMTIYVHIYCQLTNLHTYAHKIFSFYALLLPPFGAALN